MATKISSEPDSSKHASLSGGVSQYAAPELLDDSGQTKHGLGIDVWSAGVVLYICLCGFSPFSDELYSRDFPFTLSQQIKSGRFDYPSPYWDPVGDPALDLIDGMLIVDLEKRFDIKQRIDYPCQVGEYRASLRSLYLCFNERISR
ncbi:Protein kinase domain-containing protein [Fusarium sp. LHS14.1]|nr:Protein kinase domain-containing protein [Fusarium sp. LHS14.1]